MEPDTDSLESLINAERDMVLNAQERHGDYYTHALQMVMLLNNMALSIDRPERYLFVAFLSHVKKHITLALFSAVRRHHVQMGMDLRQVLESVAWAAYALVHEDLDLFRVNGPNGFEVPERLSRARNTWLTEHYPASSNEIRRLKDIINNSMAHANITQAMTTFALAAEETSGFTTSFFDPEDEYHAKMDLLMVANFAMGAINLFGSINNTERVFRTPDDFGAGFVAAVAIHNQLRAEMQQHPRLRASVEGQV